MFVDRIIFRYVLQNKHVNRIEYKRYTLEQIEELGLSSLFPVHDYEILSRDRFSGKIDTEGNEVFEGDRVIVTYGRHNLEKNGITRMGTVIYEGARFAVKIEGSEVRVGFNVVDSIQVYLIET